MLEHSAGRPGGPDQREGAFPAQSERHGLRPATGSEWQRRSALRCDRAVGGVGGDGLPALRFPAAGQIRAVARQRREFQSQSDVPKLRYRGDMVQRFDFAAKNIAAIAIALLAAIFAVSSARAVEIDVNKGQIDPLPIAITAFVGSSEESAQAGADIAGVIANNLGHSGYFRPLPPESFIEQISNFDQEPRFGDWRQIQAKALVTGQTVMDGGRLKAQFILWDVGSQQKLAGFEFATSPKNWRRLAHLISDKLYQTMTGIPGYF